MSRRGVGNRKHTSADNAAEQEWQKRRDEAWRLSAIEGWTQPQIAKHLGVDVSTVCRDLHRARVEHRPKDLAERTAQMSAKLEHIYDSLRAGVDSGDPAACSAAIKAIAEHAKLNGLYAPEKRELSGPNGGPIDVRAAQDELLSRIARLAGPGDKKPGDPEPEPV